MPTHHLLVLCLLPLATPVAQAQNHVLSDTEFAVADWDLTLARSEGNGGTALVAQVPTGGNPDSYRYVEHTVHASPPGGTSLVGYFHGFVAQPYDPAVLGPVGWIDARIDAYFAQSIVAHALSMAVRQGGVVYAAGYQITGVTGVWNTHAFTDLTAADFKEILGTATPDFSATGAPFEVGFLTLNSTAVGSNGYTQGCDYDNFSFELSPEPVTYCTAGTSASGCQAALQSSGRPSASAASGFDLTAASVEGAKAGVFSFGTSGRQALPWGNSSSFQCVVPPVSRGSLVFSTGTKGQCDGLLTYDLNARWKVKPAQNPGPGAVVQAQLWYRDPSNTSGMTTSLSDAIEFVVGP